LAQSGGWDAVYAPLNEMALPLILKRASASRPSGEWNDEDHDMLADGAVVGRTFHANAAPVGASWMWGWTQDRNAARLVSAAPAGFGQRAREF
jgi:hypothetical protein